jgi:hypothetical protein
MDVNEETWSIEEQTLEATEPIRPGNSLIVAQCRSYLERGWRIIPIPPVDGKPVKRPLVKDWPNVRLKPDELHTTFTDNVNVGVVLGDVSGGLVDVDIDAGKNDPRLRSLAYRLAPHYLPTTRTFGHTSNPASHWLYRSPKCTSAKFHDIGQSRADKLVELRANNPTGRALQTVLPYSLHEGTGEVINWSDGNESIEEIAPDVLHGHLRRFTAALLLAKYYPDAGSRNEPNLHLAGALAKAGWSHQEAISFLTPIWDAAADPRKRDRISEVTHTFEKFGRDGNVAGLSRLRDFFSSELADALVKYLGLASEPKDCSTPSGRQLVVTRLSDYPIAPIVWLWKNKIPKGSFTLFSGPAGVGKTLGLLDVIARYTTGKDWPDGSANAVERGEVLLLNAEDHVAQSLHPRLMAAGGDTSMVHILKGTTLATDAKQKQRAIALHEDLEAIEGYLRRNPKIGLVVIDPVSNYMGGKNMNNNQDVRAVLTPVRDLAERLNITIVGNSHFSKAKRGDTTALGKIGGASALHEIPRAVWEFGPDHKDRNLFHFVCAKGNDTGSKKGMSYRIGEKAVQHKNVTCNNIGFIAWGDEEEIDADEYFAAPLNEEDGGAGKLPRCIRFLTGYVTKERPSSDVFAVAKSRGFSERTVRDAKDRCPHITAIQRDRTWFWLPRGDDGP